MTTHLPVYLPASADRILPEYTDEALRNSNSNNRFIADRLLQIPAAYRQAAMTEKIHRTIRTVGGGLRKTFETVDTGRDELAAIVQEIRNQLEEQQS